MNGLFVIDRHGRREPFDGEKIIATCRRIGLSRQRAEDVLEEIVQNSVFPVSTKKIYNMVKEIVGRYGKEYPFIYGLRKSIAELDSQSFEKYTSKLLSALGYSTEWNVIIEGYAVEHQIDVLAWKGRKYYIVECKRHVNPHRDTGLDVTLQVQARKEDILDGIEYGRGHAIEKAWVFTNTKFSHHAIQYAETKDILLTGWKYKGEQSLERVAHLTKLIPITMMSSRELDRLPQKGIITFSDFLEQKERAMQLLHWDDEQYREAARLMKKIMAKLK